MAGHYRLGARLPATPGSVMDIVRQYVAADPGISHSHLIAQMMNRGTDDWPERVRRDSSAQEVGSELWCNGYVNGAVREGYLLRD